jgi:hypothetical protein
MLSSDETKARGKPRNAKPPQNGDKAKQRNRKATAQLPEADQSLQSAPEQAEAEMPAADIETVAETETPALPSSAGTAPDVSVVAKESAAVSYRALADAWGNYSRTSLEQTKVYFEKLAGVRSLGAAFEVQAEFAKQACDTFVAESQRIGELHGELAKQRLKRLEGFMGKLMPGVPDRR